jgi:hypothetical protein
LPDLSERVEPLARRGRPLFDWLLVLGLAIYILWATVDWEVPQPGGIRFGPLWLAVALALGGAWILAGRRLTPLTALAICATVGMVLTDVTYVVGQNLRDLHLYVHAGRHFLDGDQVYLDRLFTTRPVDLSMFPYLYPPLTLPLAAVLALPPQPFIDGAWLAASIIAAVVSLRLFGVRGAWILLFLAWPPMFQGIEVGNVAVLAGLLFALAPWFGAGLVVAAIFKLYSGVAALWLVREHRIGDLIAGIAIVLGAAVITLPLTGMGRWGEWLAGLTWYRASQPLLAGSLYGFGLARYLPLAVFVAVAAAVTIIALRARGRVGLARLGLATVVASPSLYAHGLIVGIPAFLLLRVRWLWLALGITSVAPGLGWWMAICLGVLAWLAPGLVRAEGRTEMAEKDDWLHPLPPGAPIWPTYLRRPTPASRADDLDAATSEGYGLPNER